MAPPDSDAEANKEQTAPPGQTGSFCIVVSEDQMKAYIKDLTPPVAGGSLITQEQVLHELESLNIIHGIDAKRINEILTNFHTAPDEQPDKQDSIIANGTEPQKGEDGELIWHIDNNLVFSGECALRKNDLIATYKYATAGINGKDVFGNITKADPGSNKFPKLGSGVETNKTGNADEYRAKWLGVVEHESSEDGDIINVDTTLSVTEDGMEASMDLYGTSVTGEEVTLEDILDVLNANKIRHGIDDATISALLAEARANGPQKGCIVAKGTPAVEGKDAELTIVRQNSSAGTELADGRIDFHERDYPWNVNAGEVVGQVSKAEPTVEAIPVWGGELKITPGKEIELDLIGLEKAEEGDLKANTDGALIMRGESIEIVELLTVESSVGAATGNVNTHIPVHVKGHVEPGFKVESDKDVIINNNVEDATVSAGQDVVIKGGIRGSKSKIITPGSISAGFMENADVKVEGKITINESIINSTVVSNDTIIVGSKRSKRGAIMGGEVTATNLVQAMVLGTPAYAKTVINVGLPQELRAQLHKIERELETKFGEMAKVTQLENHLNENPEKKTDEMMGKISSTKAALQAQIDTFQEEQSHLKAEVEQADAAKVVINKTAFPGVIVNINEQSYKVKFELGSGTFRMKDGKVEFFPSGKTAKK